MAEKKKRSEMTVEELKVQQKEELKKKQAKADKELAKAARKWGKGKSDAELIAFFSITPETTAE